ncbi:hypothetical protein [Pseudomonas phage vB_PaeM_PS119XW]|uniref:Virion structural protein n=1 Tax=Pseudomonas phage vB_PaeM_PS119XW TaxID=2601632 RepID=A0A5C1K7M0_9CAUD|nr:virion structural protein [Pseudomonas phage vB_PaeM_PS119XW]QEM41895.1 hypothetical protein [Pseudomonas phage vB_PaeM_PS119XW]
MTLEKILSDLGDKPLSKAPNYRQIVAYLNGMLHADGSAHVNGNTTADEVLTEIYSLSDLEKQSKLLEKEYTGVRASDTYRSSILTASALLAILSTGVVMSVINTDGPMTSEVADIFKTLGMGLIEIIKMVISTQ